MSSLTQPSLAAKRSESRESATARAGGTSGLLWLTWRQHRWALVGSVLIAAGLIGWMSYLAAEMTNIYHQCHNTLCPDISPQYARLFHNFGLVDVSNDVLLFVQFMPLLIGVFIGVPLLAREHEQRTLLLAWSQDVSPMRWLWTKLAVLGLFVATLTAAVSVASDHLAHVFSMVGAGSLFDGPAFMDSGMLPLAVSLSMFAVGVALGAAFRRTLPAAFSILVAFIALTVYVQWRYPTLLKPLSIFRPLGLDDPGPVSHNSLIINGGIRIGPDSASNLFDSSGHVVNIDALRSMCPNFGPGTLLPCLTRNHVQTLFVYQPGTRIPAFHMILAAGYLGLGALALAAVWMIVRRTNLSAG